MSNDGIQGKYENQVYSTLVYSDRGFSAWPSILGLQHLFIDIQGFSTCLATFKALIQAY